MYNHNNYLKDDLRFTYLRNRTTLGFDFLHSFMVYAQTYAFLVQG